MKQATNVILKGFEPLQEVGFRRRTTRWCRVDDKTTQVVEVQKSKYGERYYVNVGVVIRELEDLPCGAAHRSHAYGRWSSGALERSLSFEEEMLEEERIAIVRELVLGELLPILRGLQDVPGVGQMHLGPLTSVIVLERARNWARGKG